MIEKRFADDYDTNGMNEELTQEQIQAMQ